MTEKLMVDFGLALGTPLYGCDSAIALTNSTLLLKLQAHFTNLCSIITEIYNQQPTFSNWKSKETLFTKQYEQEVHADTFEPRIYATYVSEEDTKLIPILQGATTPDHTQSGRESTQTGLAWSQ
jgi:hypothetical protein